MVYMDSNHPPSRAATSPFTTPVAGFQGAVVTSYGSDGSALATLSEFSILLSLDLRVSGSVDH